MRTLVYLAHPRLDRSEINAQLFGAAQGAAGVTCVDLYAEYPRFEIDVDREQQRLLAHDAIVLQHPLYWYSCPSLLKEWLDLVFEHGFAYGHEGHALDGKVICNAVTCGAMAEAYSPEGDNGATLAELLLPFTKSFELCRMRALPPFALFGAGHAVDEGRDREHVADYRRLLQALTQDTLDLDSAVQASLLNPLVSDPIATAQEAN